MPITIAFTLAALIALPVNLLFLRKTLRQRRNQAENYKLTGENGAMTRIAVGFVQVWAVILLTDVFLVVSGLGILFGFRPAGFLIAGIPFLSLLIGVFALRSFYAD